MGTYEVTGVDERYVDIREWTDGTWDWFGDSTVTH